MFYYGAQYYRYPNPLPQFWEEDFKKMKECGFNVVKLWVSWSIVNHKEGVCDFDDLNKLAELADKNGLKVVFNTIIENAPYWLAAKYPEAMHTSALGYKTKPHARGNTPAGGWPGLCVHNEPVKEAAARFFEETAKNFKDLPNLYGYDIWNEVLNEPIGYFSPDINTGLYCYCDATQRKFKQWLKNKYPTLDALNSAWYRKYSDWNEVYAPIQRGGYPDMLDWLTFRLEDRVEQMQWRYDTFRKVDANARLISHYAGLDKIKTAADVAGLAKVVDEWGVSTFSGYDRAGNAKEEVIYRLDVARVDAQGKRFWQSELKGGQNTGGNGHFAFRRSAMAREHTMRCWNWCVLMSGAKGLMYWQYRPEQLGPETPGNGLTDLAGRETERLRQAAWFAKFTQQHDFIAHSVPLKGEVGILRLYEADLFGYLLDDKQNWYEKAVQGAYMAFSSFNLTVDVIYLDDIEKYDLIYIPFAQMIDKKNIEIIKNYIKKGGKVVTEACTAHYLDGGYCAFQVPGEMTEVFGAEEFIAESIFDLKDMPLVTMDNGIKFKTAVYQEWFTPLGGNVVGKYDDGSAAVVENAYGNGRAIMIGTYPSLDVSEETCEENRSIFRYILDWAGKQNNVVSSDRYVKARLHMYENKYYLYIANLKNEEKEVTFSINEKFGKFTEALSTVYGVKHNVENNQITLKLKNCEGDILQF